MRRVPDFDAYHLAFSPDLNDIPNVQRHKFSCLNGQIVSSTECMHLSSEGQSLKHNGVEFKDLHIFNLGL